MWGRDSVPGSERGWLQLRTILFTFENPVNFYKITIITIIWCSTCRDSPPDCSKVFEDPRCHPFKEHQHSELSKAQGCCVHRMLHWPHCSFLDSSKPLCSSYSTLPQDFPSAGEVQSCYPCSGLLHDTENISGNWLAIDCFYNGVFLYTCPPPISLPYSQDRDTNSVVTACYVTSESLIKSLQTQLSFVSIKAWKVTWVTKKFQACLPNKQQQSD